MRDFLQNWICSVNWFLTHSLLLCEFIGSSRGIWFKIRDCPWMTLSDSVPLKSWHTTKWLLTLNHIYHNTTITHSWFSFFIMAPWKWRLKWFLVTIMIVICWQFQIIKSEKYTVGILFPGLILLLILKPIFSLLSVDPHPIPSLNHSVWSMLYVYTQMCTHKWYWQFIDNDRITH